MKEAMFYESLGDKKVRCNLCAFHCLIPNGKKGICQVRENQDGTLYTLVYGHTRVIISKAVEVDGLGKKKQIFTT